MIIREYNSSDKKQVIKMVSEILGNVFNGNPTKMEYIKEFNITKDYIIYLIAETEGEERKIIATQALKKIDNETVRLKRMALHHILN